MGSSIPGVIATFKGNIAVIVAVMVGAIAAVTPQDQILTTVVAAMSISTLCAGIFLLCLGWLKLGNLIRFIPYPVMGGFLAGTGLLIAKGAVPVMMETSLTWGSVALWFKAEHLILWGPGLLLGLGLLTLERQLANPLVVPLGLLLAMAGFYAVLAVTGTSMEAARSMGLLFHPFSLDGWIFPIGGQFWDHVDVAALTSQYGDIFAIVLISPILCLIFISAIEVGTGKDVNLERDLKAAGAINMVLGFLGGAVSFHAGADTVLGHRLGARTAAGGIFYAGISALSLMVGPHFIALCPRFIMGGLLLYHGLGFIIDWAYRSRRQMPLLDYGLVLIILFSVAGLGIVRGVMVGILIATVFFVVNYSRISVFRHIFYATDMDHALEWCEDRLLKEAAEAHQVPSLEAHLEEWFPTREMVDCFRGYLSVHAFDAGDIIFHQGDPSGALYILISGEITIYTEGTAGKPIRLLLMRSGSIMGEMGLYRASHRSASARAETPCRVAVLTIEAMNRMQKAVPGVAAEFHRRIVTLLSDRVARDDRTLQVLIR